MLGVRASVRARRAPMCVYALCACVRVCVHAYVRVRVGVFIMLCLVRVSSSLRPRLTSVASTMGVSWGRWHSVIICQNVNAY